ncbi:MAG TPA: hypothetical protein VHZ07_05940 [Bryobacteraceae bacterium]|jgi:hypothetical protein|nr:hypothetical protein [Bryobacteraceae bacterium]
MKRVYCIAGLLACAGVLSAVSTPKVGMVRCRDGAVYALYGLHANFVTGERAFSLAQAASFSDQGGLVASDGRLMLIGPDGSVQSTYFEGEGSPVLNMDGGASSAIAWLPRQSELLTWNGAQFTAIPVGLAGLVDAVRIAGVDSAELFVTESDNSVVEVTVSLPDGVVTNISGVPGASGVAFEQQSFLLFHDANGLEVQAPNGSMRTLPITQSDLRFERIGTDWVHISSASAQRDWVLHLNATVLEVSELPEPPDNSPLSKPRPISMPRTPGAAQ